MWICISRDCMICLIKERQLIQKYALLCVESPCLKNSPASCGKTSNEQVAFLECNTIPLTDNFKVFGIGWSMIHLLNLPLLNISEVVNRIVVWWLWRPLYFSDSLCPSYWLTIFAMCFLALFSNFVSMAPANGFTIRWRISSLHLIPVTSVNHFWERKNP